MPETPLRSLVVDADPWLFTRLRADRVLGPDSVQAPSYHRAFLELMQHGPFEQVFLGPVTPAGEAPRPGQAPLDLAVVLSTLKWRPVVVVITHPDQQPAAAIRTLLRRHAIRCVCVPLDAFAEHGAAAYHDALANLETS